ncbi:hypothetical protein BDP55DRAFT_635376 [Colletotrichum godetiae]|uniref:Uncharacterized protein n=1 Tax=Colletotrichum godetiae TaxID=1209918 RepID=A0AAJ0AHS0_9PEZI|nr:uncharacterized protein BDP55DRAFT_635376 [Colletotrichum godetiae]KAK1671956.1 hypothetical protein BDP55DRAFT_635376 [Colletotrichum godetiae]
MIHELEYGLLNKKIAVITLVLWMEETGAHQIPDRGRFRDTVGSRFTHRFGCVWIDTIRMTSASDWLLIRHLWANVGWATFLARGIDTQRYQPPPGTDAPLPNSRLVTLLYIRIRTNHTKQRLREKSTHSPCLEPWTTADRMETERGRETGHSRQSEAIGHRFAAMHRGHIADPEWVRSNGEVNFDEDTASNCRTTKRQGKQRGATPSSREMAGSGGQGSQETNVRLPRSTATGV